MPGSENPAGGKVGVTADMRDALTDTYTRSKLDKALPVNFTFAAGRSNTMRDLAMSIAFDSTRVAGAAALTTAERLLQSIDRRSKPNLLVISTATTERAGEKQVVLWMFPSEDIFQFDSTQASVEVLDDAFSRSSNLRKAARFTGTNTRTGFLSGRILDRQANSADRFVANFWIKEFLMADLQVGAQEGTEILAKTLRAANDALAENPHGRSQLHLAIGTLRHHHQQRISIREFCDKYLGPGEVRGVVLDKAPNPEIVNSLFELDIDRFDTLVQYRIFELDTGVFVSAPFSEIGDSVTIEGDGTANYLEARGAVVNEKIRSRA